MFHSLSWHLEEALRRCAQGFTIFLPKSQTQAQTQFFPDVLFLLFGFVGQNGVSEQKAVSHYKARAQTIKQWSSSKAEIDPVAL